MRASELLHSNEDAILLADVLQVSKAELLLNCRDIEIGESDLAVFKKYVARFHSGEPVSKIIHKREFWKSTFYVNEDVLDPRPETELIIECALKISPDAKNILDIGTGSGCILLSLLQELPAHGIGIDISEKAIAVAKRNQREISTADFLCVSWNDFAEQQTAPIFDLVVSNPPYIKTDDIKMLDSAVKNYDPIAALDGGASGLECYREIIPLLHKFLKPGGTFICEVGYDQADAVAEILAQNNSCEIKIYNDLQNIPRVVAGKISS